MDSVGTVTAGQWQRILDRARTTGLFAGVSARRYPSDPQTFFGFQRALRAIPNRYPLPPPLSLVAVTGFLA